MTKRFASFCSKSRFIAFMVLVAFAFTLVLSGCANAPTPSPKASKASTTENEYVEATFHDISFLVPKEHEGGPVSDDSAFYTLDRNSKDPGALTVHCSYDSTIDATAKSWYDMFSEFEECELVTANGIEMCLQPDIHQDEDYESMEVSFSYNDAFYSIIVDYDLDSDLGYKGYVQNFYKLIKGAEA